jgi:N-acetylmuramoyl-L-alanine amidase
MKIQNSIPNLFFFIFASLFVISFFSGCATIPEQQLAIPTYDINGITYLPLISLCQARGIDCQYDTFTRNAVLTRGAHKINLMVGETLVLVDGLAQHLKHPVEIYQGTVVVPYRFKEQVIDTLFKEFYPGAKTAIPLGGMRRIIVDAGHGGFDPGAIGRTGLREKAVNLDVAKRLAKLLGEEGVRVIMTRSSDTFIPLGRRVDIANNSQGDLFISIHTNANRVKSLSGFEVYYISPYADDAGRALWAARNVALGLDSACLASNSVNLKAILWDMIYTYNRAESIELARSICRTINRNLNTEILGIKGARFEVLRGVRMPAVLVEIGFLSNSREEKMLKNSYYRQKIAESIIEGIKYYAQGLALIRTARQ